MSAKAPPTPGMRRPAGPIRLALTCVLTVTLLLAAPAIASGPPTLGAASATDIQGVSALLTAQVNPEGLDTNYRFEYVDEATFQADQPAGFAHAATTTTTDLGSGVEDRSATAALSGLAPETTYHYRVVATNSSSPPGGTIGPDSTFTSTRGFGFLAGAAGFNVSATEAGGSPDTQAGSHPYALTTTVNFNLAGESGGQPGVPVTDGDLRDLHINLPPGLIENPTAVPRCTQAQFHSPRQSPFEESLSGESCPDRSQIGVIAVHSSFGGEGTRTFGVFNLAPPPGAPSEFGFSPFGVPITLTPHIRETSTEYGLTLDSLNFSQVFDLYGFQMTIWGTPWSIGHNGERGNCLNEAEPSFHFAKCSTGPSKTFPPRAYLTLPSSCAGPMAFSINANSWQQPAVVTDSALAGDGQGHPVSLTGCGLLGFDTVGSVQPSTDRASSATGLDFDLDLSDEGLLQPSGIAPSQIKRAVVTLPEGITLNPSVGAGLGVCTPASYAAETASSPPGAGCPNSSKIGDFSVQSPLFEEPISGSLFLAQPFDNPFNSLLAVYLVAKAPDRDILVKVAGKVSADPVSGQLVASFDNLPQLPYSHLSVHFREGQRSPLVTPSACGAYTVPIELTPWLNPNTVLRDSSSFQITAGIGGGSCPPTAAPPFNPQAQAGTRNSNAGSYSPFYLHLTRTDSEQEITSYSAQLPPGLPGKLAGIPYCPDSDIEAAKLATGVEEEGVPSCPSASQIGHTETGFGVGTVLSYAPGRIYLAGPYHGQPFSIVAIDAATVGPFDLGTIVIRSAIEVNPETAQVSIDSAGSDPIPHIIDGIPLHLRDIRVYIDRPDFTLNPTSCAPFSVTSTLTGSSVPFSNPSDIAASATDPFQVSNCSALGFAPKLGLQLSGGTKRGDFQKLRAVVSPRPGDANIASAAVTMPPSEFLDQGNIRTVCTRMQLAEEACPAGSIYGHARAITPLLSGPIEGPVYLRASSPLPELVAALHGGGIAIDLAGRIDSSHGGIRGSFEVLPDAPVSKFVLTINGGKGGILVNAANICSSPQFAKARLIAQNNQGEALRPLVGTDCARHKRHKSRHKPQHEGGKR